MVPQGYYHYFFSYNGYVFSDIVTEKVNLNAITQMSISRMCLAPNKYEYSLRNFDL